MEQCAIACVWSGVYLAVAPARFRMIMRAPQVARCMSSAACTMHDGKCRLGWPLLHTLVRSLNGNGKMARTVRLRIGVDVTSHRCSRCSTARSAHASSCRTVCRSACAPDFQLHTHTRARARTHMHTHTHAHTRARTHTSACAHKHVCTHTGAHTHAHWRAHARTVAQTQALARVHTRTRVRSCDSAMLARVHARAHTNTNARAHKHAHRRARRCARHYSGANKRTGSAWACDSQL